MTLGLRQLLLLAATVVFVVAIFINGANWTDWIAVGLACFAGAFLVGEMGWDRTMGGGGTRHNTTP
jgi:protein-S-isoprenylcysteine O-methyltransferase Ste14